ncbi:MAG: N-acetylneuraminate synthase family protein [Planctomycetota bacterium]
MRIADRDIGPGHEPYVIAEIGVNHDGDPARALELIRLAATTGADAIKLQLFETDRLMSSAAKLAAYQKASGETDPIAMLRRLELGHSDMRRCFDLAHDLGMHAVVSVFSTELVGRAMELGVDAFKAASPDIVHEPLLRALGATGRPLIVSTGTAEITEIERASNWLRAAQDRLAFLHCVSSYPTPPDAANVSACCAVAAATPGCPVGYSDHTERTDTGLAAVVHGGASILEKHFSDDRKRAGPDHRASLEPEAFAEYVRTAKRGGIEPDARLIGDGSKVLTDMERDVRTASRQSVVSTRYIPEGSQITPKMLTIKRPGTGIPPSELAMVSGQTAARDIEDDVPITEADLV